MQLQNVRHSFDLAENEIGVTIRKGTKWAEVTIGQTFDLWVCQEGHAGLCREHGCEYQGTGVKIGWWTGPLNKLPFGLIELEHNRMARDPQVLMRLMTQAYPGFRAKDIVTALIYLRTSKQSYCDTCQHLTPKEDEQRPRVSHYCEVSGEQILHCGHHPRLPQPRNCPLKKG